MISMILLELFCLLPTIYLLITGALSKYIGIPLIIFMVISFIVGHYEMKMPNIKMKDDEISANNVTFKTSNIFELQ